ncbi:hypothetical protein CONLIGDRAFT_66147 [Coniochaeta ligniaria NRRL 30616]|uniref:Uncharacterized protein n=1 Tax=Coniochaeta ligniaria NRRL 30616 TaxID=1408157 RepID=A0A1J7K1P0_9PEZI|nr:hypothetical protein CONLIGDRAFT_66147 [Coniochaeta ligniaria NRRL 30616]
MTAQPGTLQCESQNQLANVELFTDEHSRRVAIEFRKQLRRTDQIRGYLCTPVAGCTPVLGLRMLAGYLASDSSLDIKITKYDEAMRRRDN